MLIQFFINLFEKRRQKQVDAQAEIKSIIERRRIEAKEYAKKWANTDAIVAASYRREHAPEGKFPKLHTEGDKS